MKEYLENRINHYYDQRKIAYENKVSTYLIDIMIEELEIALMFFNQLKS